MQTSLLFGLVALSLASASPLIADGAQEKTSQESCGKGPRPMRVTARHIEGNGVGYTDGYTTVEGFFSPLQVWRDNWTPFLDLRGHVFNNGKLAANAGIGLRYLAGNRVWGGNFYYDYRNTKHQHYNQVSMGFESLGTVWDFRINGYLPVGVKESNPYHLKFSHFKGNEAILSQRYQFAMKGANAEAGAHVDSIKNFPFYFAAGPYYLEGHGKISWGGQARAAVDIYEYVRLEGSTSYDSVFKWIGQGQVSLNIPFGKRKAVKHRPNHTCHQEMALASRAVQRVDRNEIIPVDTSHKYSPAINPATGQPYFFLFVSNKSHSAGTYESPYPTLDAAEASSGPGSIVYIFPGDGTSNGMNMGITLLPGQMLIGSAAKLPLSTTLGSISIPSQSSSFPVITNTNMAPVVNVVSNNTISGLQIQNLNGAAITDNGTPITNLTVAACQIIGGMAPVPTMTPTSINAINLTDISGTLSVSNSVFTQSDPAPPVMFGNTNSSVNITMNTATCDAIFTNNTFNGRPVNGNFVGGIAVINKGGGFTNFIVTDCTFQGNNYGGINFLMNSGTITNYIVSGSTFTQNNNYGAIYNSMGSGTLSNMEIVNCSFENNSHEYGGAINNFIDSVTFSNMTIAGCTFISNTCYDDGGGAIYTEFNGTIGPNAIFANNLFQSNTGTNAGALYNQMVGVIAGGLTISGNTFANNTSDSERSGAIFNDISNTTSTTLTMSSNIFDSNVGSAASAIYNTMSSGSIISLTVSDSTFTNNGGTYFNTYAGAITTVVNDTSTCDGSLTNNSFTANSNVGMYFQIKGSNSTSWEVLGNTFNNSLGYAVYFDNTAATTPGPTCLDFAGNTASPAQTVPGVGAYLFNNTASAGTFLLAPPIPQSVNTGEIQIEGTVMPIPEPCFGSI